MSLPPALLARLKQRGIIKETKDEEEVFAESYDKEDDDQIDASEKNRGGAPGCPNKYNHYHLCTSYCFDHWREGYPETRLSEKYLQQRQKMLKQYPLSSDWKEVYDAGMRRHYYWCTLSDEVSWLPPKHPKAVISEAAPKIAKEMFENVRGAATDSSSSKGKSERTTEKSDGRSSSRRDRKDHRYRGRDKERRRRADDSGGESDSRRSRSPTPETELNERDKLRRAKRKGIDPMDPAAYGDAPVGGWGSGLTVDVKTGADVTANGPLFQQRPYPAPGAILRRNNPDFDKDNE